MAVGLEHDAILASETPAISVKPGGIAGIVDTVNEAAFTLSAIALLTAAAVLTFGVTVGHTLGTALAWQDEVTIFLIAGAVFLSAAAVQARRGHIGIEVLDHILPPRVNGARRAIVDGVVLVFCLLFAWEAGGLLHEALLEGQTSHSAWGPPLWIPYLVLTIGMTMLAVQVA
jgi:C4-dicarboxylate transporter DctM subunit